MVSILSIIFAGKPLNIFQITNEYDHTIVQQRLFQVILSLLAGIGLSVAGNVMQATTHNKLADPSILGTASSTSLFVLMGISFFHLNTNLGYICFGLVGSILSTCLIFVLSYKQLNPNKIILIGMVINIAINAITNTILMVNDNSMNIYRFWQVGSVANANLSGILLLLPLIIIGVSIAMYLARVLDILSLGEDNATGVGVNIKQVYVLSILTIALLCGGVCSVVGPISFVGLIVPNIIRKLGDFNLKWSILLSAILGSIILISANLISKIIIYPQVLEVGIIMPIIGVPILLSLLHQKRS